MKEKKLRVIGNKGEEISCNFLLRKGFEIVTRNYYSQHGEIDIIAQKNNTIIFVEVKTRNKGFDTAFKSVSASKQKKMHNTAAHFLAKNTLYEDFFTRFDVIAVTTDGKIKHLPDAFRL